MQAKERQKIILDQIYSNGMVKVTELSKELGVHEETIRRDLKALSSHRGIEIIYGGAVLKNLPPAPTVEEIILQTKRLENYEKKCIVAKKAASLIQPGDTIGLNSGSTVELILNFITDKAPLNIITLNVHIASKASQIPGMDVFIPGGNIRNKSGSVIGGDAVKYLHGFTLDCAFLGVSAVSFSKGIGHPNKPEVEVNQAMAQISKKNYIVTDSSKLNKTAPFHMYDLQDIHGFIVDDEFPDDYREFLELHSIDII